MPQIDVLASFLSGRVLVGVGDITDQHVDAIVNAANQTLLGGGGVDGAIHEEGGPSVLAVCRGIRRPGFPEGLPTGEAVITSGGLLPAPWVIHTVGPVKIPGLEPDAAKLAACYRNCLRLAVEAHLSSIAFPSISTGAFGYPRDNA